MLDKNVEVYVCVCAHVCVCMSRGWKGGVMKVEIISVKWPRSVVFTTSCTLELLGEF